MADEPAPAPPLGTVLTERASEILASWIARFERSPMRFRRTTKAATHAAQVASLIDSLIVACATSAAIADLQSGSDATRELERNAAFLGARFAGEGATGFDVAALLLELRDTVAPLASIEDRAVLTRIFEWLVVVAQDAFAASGMQSLRERQAEDLETGTPVIEILPKVPAVLLVGTPNAGVVDGLLSRAWMLAVGTGAPCLIIDVGGLSERADQALEAGYKSFLEQARGSALQILLSSARRAVRERATSQATEAGLSIQVFDRFDSAVAHAIERAPYTIVRRP